MRQTFLRALNGIRKVAAGLRPFSESVWPGVRNDLFVAHESIYRFFASDVGNLDILDAGCGTGYGSHLLAEAGAESVIGVDLDRRNIAFARKRYSAPNLSFAVADIEELDSPTIRSTSWWRRIPLSTLIIRKPFFDEYGAFCGRRGRS